MVADLTRGSGRFNVALGAATMVQGIGAAVSTTLAGAIIVLGGYTTAMGVLTGGIAVLALVLLVIGGAGDRASSRPATGTQSGSARGGSARRTGHGMSPQFGGDLVTTARGHRS